MIKYYKKPIKITIRKMIDDMRNNVYYIKRFDYGEYDNTVDAVIYNLDLTLSDITRNKACLRTTYSSVGNLKDTFVGYSNPFDIFSLEEFLDRTETVIGKCEKYK